MDNIRIKEQRAHLCSVKGEGGDDPCPGEVVCTHGGARRRKVDMEEVHRDLLRIRQLVVSIA